MKYPKTFGRPEAVWNKLGGEEGVDRFLRGKTVVSTPGSNILTIDREVKPTYSDWMKEVMHPELENTGPSHLDPGSAVLYLHPKQKNGGVMGGDKLYGFLKDTGLIEHCLDLRVGEELAGQPHLWPAVWKGKAVSLWKSVVLDHDGNLSVPHVYENFSVVSVYWVRLDFDWTARNPTVLSTS
jgi:hypothetical protein